MSEIGRPGFTASMPSIRHSWVTRTRRFEPSSTSPTRKVAFVSPCTPSRYSVTSRLTMSPSASGRSSGMPWQMTSFTEVHSDLREAVVVEGARIAALLDARGRDTIASSSSVVMPGRTAAPVSASTSAAERPVRRMRSMIVGRLHAAAPAGGGHARVGVGGALDVGGHGRQGLIVPGTMRPSSSLWHRLYLRPLPHQHGSFERSAVGAAGAERIPFSLRLSSGDRGSDGGDDVVDLREDRPLERRLVGDVGVERGHPPDRRVEVGRSSARRPTPPPRRRTRAVSTSSCTTSEPVGAAHRLADDLVVPRRDGAQVDDLDLDAVRSPRLLAPPAATSRRSPPTSRS